MKKQSREIYLELATEIGWGLCSFCKYGEFDGSPCYDEIFECKHPLEVIRDSTGDIMDGFDCWGYCPQLPLSDIADIVGLILSEGFDPGKTIYYPSKENIQVVGIKRVI